MLTLVLAGFAVLMFVIAVSYYRENEQLKNDNAQIIADNIILEQYIKDMEKAEALPLTFQLN